MGTLFNMDQRTPLGWPEQGAPTRAQGPYYCSVGPENSFGRQITDCLYRACLYAGLEIPGVDPLIFLAETLVGTEPVATPHGSGAREKPRDIERFFLKK